MGGGIEREAVLGGTTVGLEIPSIKEVGLSL